MDNRAYVARFDYNFSANHSVFWRGTLADNFEALRPQRIPTDDALRSGLDNSKGFAAQYNATLTTNLIDTFTWGLARRGFQRTGWQGPLRQVAGIQGGGICAAQRPCGASA